MKLTPEQNQIVNLNKGQHLVLAPPGTGKTELLVQRLSNAVKDGVNQHKMICLTFTNRAAKNMLDRVEKEIGVHDIFIGNIHSYCNTFLRQNNIIPYNTSLLDEEDVELLVSESKEEVSCYVVDRNNGKERYINTNELLAYNTYVKQKKLGFPQEILQNPNLNFTYGEACAIEICMKYEKIKEESNFIDFDDLLTMTYRKLHDNNENEPIFEWLQIDEVQDLNPLQWAIVNGISDKEKSHRVFFGDYEQAIFSFMGAKLEVLDKVGEESEIHYLQNNFRSPQYLLDLYNSYATAWLNPKWKYAPKSQNLIEKIPNSLSFKEIIVQHETERYSTEEEEIDWIIQKKLPKEPSDVTAILVRTNATADKFSSKFDKHGIHYFKISGFDLFRRKEIKDIMAFFSVIVNDSDRNSWIRNFHLYGKIKSLKDSRNFVNSLFNIGLKPLDFTDKNSSKESYLDDFFFSLQEQRLIVFDTETTGLDTANDDIIQIAAIEIVDGMVAETFEVFLNTDKDLTESEKVHKISKSYLNDFSIDRTDALQKFIDFVGDDILVAHNLDYDYKIVNSNLAREGLLPISNTVKLYDSIEIAKRVYPKLPSYKLEFLLNTLNIEGKNSHNALDDVKATVNLIVALGKVINKGKEQRLDFIHRYETILNNFKERFSPIYNAIFGNFSNEMPLNDVVNMVMNYMEGSLNYKTTENIYSEIDKLLRHMETKCVLDEVFVSINRYIPEYVKYKESDLVLGNEKIVIATIHKAKGLEFENVIIPGCTDDNYPGYYSKKNGEEGILEDARLLYVAMTRTKKRLLITSHTLKVIQTYRGPWELKQIPSRFLTPVLGLLK